jgi:TonB family protein
MKITALFASFAAIAACLAGCSSTKVERGFYGPKQPQYSIGVDKEGRKNGKETWWYQNGARKYEAMNRGGFRDGKFTAWYPDGKLWYEGYEFHGKPESTLTYWHPNGRVKSKALFRDGIQLERKDYDEEGRPILRGLQAAAAEESSPDQDAPESDGSADNLRKASLRMWAMRVRQTVEGFWVLPKQFGKERPYRAVARIKVSRDGKIIGVSWSEKSPSSAFNNLAQQTFKRIKRLPAFPPQVKDQTLEVQYEFISLGKQAPRKRLEAREDTGE